MHFNTKLIIAFLVAAMTPSSLASLQGGCSGSYMGVGVCVHTADCTANGGSYISGFCPGDPEDVKCCVKKVQVGNQIGKCLPTYQCYSGRILDGYCPGNESVKLCIQ